MAHCASCQTLVDPLDTFDAEAGKVCGICHADIEIADSLEREAYHRARTIATVPAWAALAGSLLMAVFSLFPINLNLVAVGVALIAGFSGAAGLWSAVAQPDLRLAIRVRLALGSVFNLLVLWVVPVWYLLTLAGLL